MTNATRVTVPTFGVFAGLAGIEHGIGQVLQGNVAPEEVMILSLPDVVVYVLALSAFGLLLLTLFCAFAHDVQEQQS